MSLISLEIISSDLSAANQLREIAILSPAGKYREQNRAETSIAQSGTEESAAEVENSKVVKTCSNESHRSLHKAEALFEQCKRIIDNNYIPTQASAWTRSGRRCSHF